MRQRYVHIKSQKQLRELIQHNIDIYKNRRGWKEYAESLQRKLDENKFHDIASLWGIFEKSVRLDEKGKQDE